MTTENRKTTATILRVLALIMLVLAILSCAHTQRVRSTEGRSLDNRGWEDDDDLEIY